MFLPDLARIILGFVFLLQCFGLVSMEAGIEMEVAKAIFADYDPGVRPINRTQEAINITIMYKLYQLVDMDDSSETITTISWISMYWIDPLLKWNPSDFIGVDSIFVPCTRVWRPDITVYNGVQEGDQDLRLFESFNAQVHSDGLVRWSIRTMLKTTCSMQLADFPWDTQICNVTMASWLYDSSKVTIKADSDHADMQFFRRNGVWDVLRVPIISQSNMYPCCPEPFQELTVIYIIKRRGLYYCFNILFPSVLLLGITLLSFCIPTETGEKVSIPVTMFLSQSFLLFAITQYMPVQSDVIPAIGYILLGIMMLIGLCILCNVAVCHVYFKYTGDPPPPWIESLFFRKSDPSNKGPDSQINHLEMDFDRDITSQNMEQNDDCEVTSLGSRRAVIKLLPRSRSERINRTTPKSKYPGEKWKSIANKLNGILCTLTILATAAFSITILAVYLKSKESTAKVFHP